MVLSGTLLRLAGWIGLQEARSMTESEWSPKTAPQGGCWGPEVEGFYEPGRSVQREAWECVWASGEECRL